LTPWQIFNLDKKSNIATVSYALTTGAAGMGPLDKVADPRLLVEVDM